jgi:hypothetical protein
MYKEASALKCQIWDPALPFVWLAGVSRARAENSGISRLILEGKSENVQEWPCGPLRRGARGGEAESGQKRAG